MALEDYKREIYGCFGCAECKIGIRSQLPICPSGKKYEFNSYYSRGRLDIAKALLEGNIEWKDPSLQDPIFSCLGCGACHEACYPQMGIPTREIYRTLKSERVSRGYGPPSVYDDVLKACEGIDWCLEPGLGQRAQTPQAVIQQKNRCGFPHRFYFMARVQLKGQLASASLVTLTMIEATL